MIWLALGLLFAWLSFRELQHGISQPEGITGSNRVLLLIYLGLAVMLLWIPGKVWLFESKLTRIAQEISGHPNASVHCNTAFDAMFDNKVNRIGHANPQSGEIVLQVKWCDLLMDYIDNPQSADTQTRYSLMLFTHEVMHIRGELNEQKTECQAIQRNHMVGERLGIPQAIAKRHTRAYFQTDFHRHPYYSALCGPGKSMDEQLYNSIWQ